MPPTVRLYLTISSIRAEKARAGKLPRTWAVGCVTGSPAWAPLSGTKWVSLIQLLPKVKFSSLTIPKKKGNIYLSHICLFLFPNSDREVGYSPLAIVKMADGCTSTSHKFMGGFRSSRLFPRLSQPQNATHWNSPALPRSNSNAISRLSPVLPTPQPCFYCVVALTCI